MSTEHMKKFRSDVGELKQHIACLSVNDTFNKELNLISWYGAEPKYDIRTWTNDHSKMGKGITLDAEELRTLKDVLNALF